MAARILCALRSSCPTVTFTCASATRSGMIFISTFLSASREFLYTWIYNFISYTCPVYSDCLFRLCSLHASSRESGAGLDHWRAAHGGYQHAGRSRRLLCRHMALYRQRTGFAPATAFLPHAMAHLRRSGLSADLASVGRTLARPRYFHPGRHAPDRLWPRPAQYAGHALQLSGLE